MRSPGRAKWKWAWLAAFVLSAIATGVLSGILGDFTHHAWQSVVTVPVAFVTGCIGGIGFLVMQPGEMEIKGYMDEHGLHSVVAHEHEISAVQKNCQPLYGLK